MSEWSDRLPGYDEWRTREHNRLFWFEEEQVMDEREAEEKRDAEIRSGITPVKYFTVETRFKVDGEDAEIRLVGDSMILKFGGGSIYITKDLWERLSYAVERTLEEAR